MDKNSHFKFTKKHYKKYGKCVWISLIDQETETNYKFSYTFDKTPYRFTKDNVQNQHIFDKDLVFDIANEFDIQLKPEYRKKLRNSTNNTMTMHYDNLMTYDEYFT